MTERTWRTTSTTLSVKKLAKVAVVANEGNTKAMLVEVILIVSRVRTPDSLA